MSVPPVSPAWEQVREGGQEGGVCTAWGGASSHLDCIGKLFRCKVLITASWNNPEAVAEETLSPKIRERLKT